MHHHPQNQERALNLSILIVSGNLGPSQNVLRKYPLRRAKKRPASLASDTRT
ncbi:hypothetical protein F4807DRAFT_449079 [Annulohypoxylon truncatum]|nr:hypothetical protein F4807DRAFT_449079 [Annulohypoxylon truncatum]